MLVSGDGEGGIEMTGSMQLIREFCDLVISPEKATRTRIVGAEIFETFTRFLMNNFPLFKILLCL